MDRTFPGFALTGPARGLVELVSGDGQIDELKIEPEILGRIRWSWGEH